MSGCEFLIMMMEQFIVYMKMEMGSIYCMRVCVSEKFSSQSFCGVWNNFFFYCFSLKYCQNQIWDKFKHSHKVNWYDSSFSHLWSWLLVANAKYIYRLKLATDSKVGFVYHFRTKKEEEEEENNYMSHSDRMGVLWRHSFFLFVTMLALSCSTFNFCMI